MKNCIKGLFCILFLLSSFSFLYSNGSEELDSAIFLWENDIIKSYWNDETSYRLNDTITRKETMKVVIKLSWLNIEDKCEWKFQDVVNDWWCKYIEEALKAWFIAQNELFRPDDNITKTEAMKLVLKAKWIPKTRNTENWQEDYMETAYEFWIIDEKYYDFNTDARRGWIFVITTATIQKEEEIKEMIEEEKKTYSDETSIN